MSLRDISIVIPTHDRVDSLKRLIESIDIAISRCTLNIEVIIVDDGSTDQTRDIDVLGTHKVIHRQNCGPAAARNYGVTLASALVIMFIDDDCVVTDYGLASLERCLPVDQQCCFAEIFPIPNESPSLIERYLNRIGFPGAPWYGNSGKLLCMPSACFVIRRCDFERSGGFSEQFSAPGGEDDLFTQSLVANNIKIEVCAGLAILHDNTCSLSQFIRRHIDYGRGHELLCARYGASRQDYELEFSGLLVLVIRIIPLVIHNIKRYGTYGLRDKTLHALQLISIKIGAFLEQKKLHKAKI